MAILSLETLEQRVLLENAETARYVPTGHILYFTDVGDRIFAVAFDPKSQQVSGERFRVVDAAVKGDSWVSQEGALAYYSLDTDMTETQTVVINQGGKAGIGGGNDKMEGEPGSLKGPAKVVNRRPSFCSVLFVVRVN